MRIDGRENTEKRIMKITRNYQKYAEGSVLIECGDTHVICSATVSFESVPFRAGKGWVTAEYNMLPRATLSRNKRDISNLKKNSRATEIERLIGRSLRASVDLDAFNDITIIIDCDVIQADGGTRTASITGGYIAMYDAFSWLKNNGYIAEIPVKQQVAAISAGIVDGVTMVDLCYAEDSKADVDLNLVMTADGRITEIQATAEGNTFSREELNRIIDISEPVIKDIMEIQRKVLMANE